MVLSCVYSAPPTRRSELQNNHQPRLQSSLSHFPEMGQHRHLFQHPYQKHPKCSTPRGILSSHVATRARRDPFFSTRCALFLKRNSFYPNSFPSLAHSLPKTPRGGGSFDISNEIILRSLPALTPIESISFKKPPIQPLKNLSLRKTPQGMGHTFSNLRIPISERGFFTVLGWWTPNGVLKSFLNAAPREPD